MGATGRSHPDPDWTACFITGLGHICRFLCGWLQISRIPVSQIWAQLDRVFYPWFGIPDLGRSKISSWAWLIGPRVLWLVWAMFGDLFAGDYSFIISWSDRSGFSWALFHRSFTILDLGPARATVNLAPVGPCFIPYLRYSIWARPGQDESCPSWAVFQPRFGIIDLGLARARVKFLQRYSYIVLIIQQKWYYNHK